MRVVLDTNVLIAALVARGQCHDVLVHCERHHHLVISPFIINELEAKLVGKFKVPVAKAAEAAHAIAAQAEVIDPPPLDQPACRDPDDDGVLATALHGQCTCLITGDKDLLVLDPFRDIRILAPNAFWAFEATWANPTP